MKWDCQSVGIRAKGRNRRSLGCARDDKVRGPWRIASSEERMAKSESPLVQEELGIQRVALCGTEAGVANDAPQLFFGGAIANTCGAHHILLNHH